MNEADLMIGNYAKDQNGNITRLSAHDIYLMSITIGEQKAFKNIPLDEEWLNKFEEINCISEKECIYELIFDKYRKLTMIKTTIDDRLLDVYLWVDFNDEEGNKLATRIEIKYVHQLQNYYYWNKLTGEKLTHKKP